MGKTTLVIEDMEDGKIAIRGEAFEGPDDGPAYSLLIDILAFAASKGEATLKTVKADGSAESVRVGRERTSTELLLEILALIARSGTDIYGATSLLGSAYLLAGTEAQIADDTLVSTLRSVAAVTPDSERRRM